MRGPSSKTEGFRSRATGYLVAKFKPNLRRADLAPAHADVPQKKTPSQIPGWVLSPCLTLGFLPRAAWGGSAARSGLINIYTIDLGGREVQ